MKHRAVKITDTFAGRKITFRCLLEWRFARILEYFRRIGDISSWRYEAVPFFFRDKDLYADDPRGYLPDFTARHTMLFVRGKIHYECKPLVRITEDEIRKLELMNTFYPKQRIIYVVDGIKRNGNRAALKAVTKHCVGVFDMSKLMRKYRNKINFYPTSKNKRRK